MTVETRPATDADRDAVLALLVAQLREHGIDTPEARIAHAVDGVLRHGERGQLFVATADGRVVGVAALSFIWPLEHGGLSTWLEELYVVPSLRGQGIGGALLGAACDHAAARGAAAVDLEVDGAHRRAARLYERAGFRPLDRARLVRPLAPSGVPRGAEPPADLLGGCLCGAVRYHVTAVPIDVSHCHCAICRRATGAPFVTWATFPRAAFALTAGTPAELRATPRAVRTFCAACGTALTFHEVARPRSVDVTVGSLDRPDAVAPRDHIWTSSQLRWLQLDDALPRHEGENPGERDAEEPR